MSKTFKNATNEGTELYVGEGINTGSVQLVIRNVGEGIGKAGIYLNSSDIPALTLAILEAAGVEPDREPLECQVSLGTIVADLQRTIRYAEALASANREQAKLEDEALELFNAGDVEGEFQSGPYDSFAQIHDYAKPKWLAVARKAREMRAEK